MWYFTWILGVLFACSCGIINVMWLEHEHLLEEDESITE
ncbi:MAG: cytochrome bd-I oxidase subunit CydX [Proteobacteria bacterium]|nr:cytochrome bd-I oxidase subunit CydX [Pseudomonadota bacterium]